MSAPDRIPRLCAGDSPAECLKAARRFMREARAAAEAGDRIAAGTALAAACSTGAYMIPGGIAADPLASVKALFDPLQAATVPQVELAETRYRLHRAELEKQSRRMVKDSRGVWRAGTEPEEIPEESEIERAFWIATEADRIAREQWKRIEEAEREADRKAWQAENKRPRRKRTGPGPGDPGYVWVEEVEPEAVSA